MTPTSSVTPGFSLNSTTAPTKVLGKNEDSTDKQMFLKLMIAQLQNQDPTSPVDQQDMMASITQFSQVEQMQNMSTAMETLSLTQGTGLIGKSVEYTVTLKDSSGQVLREESRTGVVGHVEQTSSGIKLVMQDDNPDDNLDPLMISPASVTKVFA